MLAADRRAGGAASHGVGERTHQRPSTGASLLGHHDVGKSKFTEGNQQAAMQGVQALFIAIGEIRVMRLLPRLVLVGSPANPSAHT